MQPKLQTRDCSINKSLSFQEIRWGATLDALVEQYHLNPAEAQKILLQLFNKLLGIFEVYWFRASKLSRDENRVIAGLCSIYKTGIITIFNQRTLGFGPLRFDYQSKVRFAPDWEAFRSGEAGGTCFPEIRFRVFGQKFVLTKTYQVGVLRLLLLALAIVGYVVFVGGILYCIAVFLVFGRYPLATIKEAMSNPPMGVALIGSFLILAMLLQGTVQYLWRLSTKFNK